MINGDFNKIRIINLLQISNLQMVKQLQVNKIFYSLILASLFLAVSVTGCYFDPSWDPNCNARDLNNQGLFCPCTNCSNNLIIVGWRCVAPILCDPNLLQCVKCHPDNSTCVRCTNNSYTLRRNNTCQLCSISINFCATCSSRQTCDTCINNSYAVNSGACTLCSKLMNGCQYCSSSNVCTTCLLGVVVKSGCSKVIGCIQVYPNLDLSINCLSCNSTLYKQSAVNGSCVCNDGWLIGSLCGNVIGCTNLLSINLTNICVSCSGLNNFVLYNQICICKTYYQLVGTKCSEICGDGYLLALPCDDGNLINGDGCSSTCNVQQDCVCETTANFPASQCQFKGRVLLILSQITRVKNANQAQITFNIEPYKQTMSKMDIANLVNFTAAFCSVDNIALVNQQLVITVSYNATITNENAKVSIQYDRTYVLSPNFTKNFKMTLTNGGELIYYPYIGDISENILRIMYMFSVSILFIFAFGSFAYKMIGVETIHTYQILLLLVVKSSVYSYIFTYLSNFSILYGQFYLIPNQISLSPIKHQYFQRLGYSQSPFQDYQILAIAQIFFIILYIMIKIYSQYMKDKLLTLKDNHKDLKTQINTDDEELLSFKDNQQQILSTVNRLKKILNCIYNCLLFPILVGFFFHFNNSLFIQNIFGKSDNSSILKICHFLVPLIALAKYGVFFQETKTFFIFNCQVDDKMLKPSCQKSYIPFYLISSILLLGVIQASLIGLNKYQDELSVLIIGSHLIYICFKRPYQRNIHNIAIFFNQTTLFLTILWLLFERYFSLSYEIEKLLLYGLFGMIVTVLLLSLARTICAIWRNYVEYFQQQQPNILNSKLSKDKKQKRLQIVNYKDPQLALQQQQKQLMTIRRDVNLKADINPLSSMTIYDQQYKNQNKNDAKKEKQNLLHFYREEVRKKLIQQ